MSEEFDSQTPWVALSDVCKMYGVKFETAKGQVANSTFPVETYRVGRTIVIDKEVHKNYFLSKRTAGLLALNSTLS